MKLTEESCRDVYDCIKKGLTKAGAATVLGISEYSLYEWIKIGKSAEDKYRENKKLTKREELCLNFKNSIRTAEEDLKEHLLKKIQDIGQKEGKWQAFAWILERRFRNEFGRAVVMQDEDDESTQDLIDAIKGIEAEVQAEHG